MIGSLRKIIGGAEDMFDALSGMQIARMQFIVNSLNLYYGKVAGLKILDVGCGIGLFSESAARLGAVVTGIDESPQNISRAIERSRGFSLNNSYESYSCENWESEELFDVVVALEVVEHCIDPQFFLNKCRQRLKPKGMLIVSTINKNISSLLLAKFAAEYILRIVPAGTHQWEKFITPGELRSMLSRCGLDLYDMSGIEMTLSGWSLRPKPRINYLISAVQ